MSLTKKQWLNQRKKQKGKKTPMVESKEKVAMIKK